MWYYRSNTKLHVPVQFIWCYRCKPKLQVDTPRVSS
ncbi:unnamed protein product [Tenebrio molitor]|nr:unnamed protein product [Tenebrio molitor]